MDQINTDSMVDLLEKIKQGRDQAAEQELWNRYFDQLLVVSRQQLQARARRVRDEEDIALSVLNSFFRGAAVGRFSQLNDRSDLWLILRVLTIRKTVDHLRRIHVQKRGGDAVRGESVFFISKESSPGNPDVMPGKQAEPDLAAIFTEECDRLFAALRDKELSQIALLRLEGYSNEEMAQQLGRSVRSIERKLNTIRAIWLMKMKEDKQD